MREAEVRQFPGPEIQQPDPMLDEQPAGWGRIALTALGGVLVLGIVFYGLSRPAGPPQQMAETEQAATAPAGGGAASNAPGQAQQANAPAQNPQPNPQQPTTTGQGTGDKAAGDKGAPGQGRAGQSKTPPAAGSSATSATGPGAKPAPQAK
jgi:hypothetical protein